MFNYSKIIIPLLFFIISTIIFVILHSTYLVENDYSSRNLNLNDLMNLEKNSLDEINLEKKNNLNNLLKTKQPIQTPNEITNYYNKLFQHENFSFSALGGQLKNNIGTKHGNKRIERTVLTSKLANSLNNAVKQENQAALTKYYKDLENRNQLRKQLLSNNAELNRLNGVTYERQPIYFIINNESTKNIYYSNEIGSNITQLPEAGFNGKCVDISATDELVVAINTDGKIYVKNKHDINSSWVKIPGLLQMISCDSNSIIGVNRNGDLFFGNFTSSNQYYLQSLSDSSSAFWKRIRNGYNTCTATGNTYFYALTVNNKIHIIKKNSIYDSPKERTLPQNSVGVGICADKDYLWIIDYNRNLFRTDIEDFNQNKYQWKSVTLPGRGEKTPYPTVWPPKFNNHISYIDSSDPNYICISDYIGWTYYLSKNNSNYHSTIRDTDWEHWPSSGQIGYAIKLIGSSEHTYTENRTGSDYLQEDRGKVCCIKHEVKPNDPEYSNDFITFDSKNRCNSNSNCAGFQMLLDGTLPNGDLDTVYDYGRVCFSNSKKSGTSKNPFYQKKNHTDSTGLLGDGLCKQNN